MFCQMRKNVVMVIFISSHVLCQNNEYKIENFLGNLINSVLKDHETSSVCNVFVTQEGKGAITKFRKKENPVYHVVETDSGTGNLEHFVFNEDLRKSIWRQEPSFQRALLFTLNEGCSGYVLQTAKPKATLRLISYLLRLSTARMVRTFVLLPPTNVFASWPHIRHEYANESEVFSMKETDFLPDIVLLRPECAEIGAASSSSSIPKMGHVSERAGLHTSQLKDDGLARGNDAAKVGRLGLEMALDSTDADSWARRDLGCGSTRKELIVEAVTHKFSYPEPSRTLVLGRWAVSSADEPRAGRVLPDKMADLGGRPMAVTAIDYLPYTVMNFLDQHDVNDGTEFRLLRELKRRLNGTWRMVLDQENLWGDIYEDGSGNGIVGLVSEDSADIGLGAVYMWYSKYPFVDYTYPHAVTGVTCVVPRPRPLPAWMTPVLPFNRWSWAVVVASLPATALVLRGVAAAAARLLGVVTHGYFTTFTDCVVRTVGMLVLQIPGEDPRNVPMRHLILWLSFMYTLVTSCYNAGISSVLTLPRYEPPVDTVTDLAKSGIFWAASDIAWIISIEDAEDPDMQTVVRNFKVFNESILEKKSAENEVAFSIERLFGGNFAVNDYIRPEFVGNFRLMKEDLYRAYCTMVVRKGSPYTEKINRLVHSVTSSGLWYHWEGEVTRRYMLQKVQLAVTTSSTRVNKGPKKMRVPQIEGPLFLLAIGLALSIALLLLEILYHKNSHPGL